MKTLLKITIISIVVISIYFIYNLRNNNQIDYLNLGDSYAKGLNSYNEKIYGYSDYFKDYLKNTNNLNSYNMYYTSENETIDSLINKIKTTNELKHSIRESDIITLSIGLNDLIYTLSKMPNPTTYQIDNLVYEHYQNLENLIKEISNYTTNKIYIIGYNNKIFSTDLFYAVNKLNNYYSKNKNIIFIKSPKKLENIKKYYPNPKNFHPTEEGYNLIYKEILKKYLKYH